VGYFCQVTLVDDDSVDVAIGARGWIHEHAKCARRALRCNSRQRRKIC
jgi:hypothetical protein